MILQSQIILNTNKDYIIINFASELERSYMTPVKNKCDNGIDNAIMIDDSSYRQETGPIINYARMVLDIIQVQNNLICIR